MSSLLVLLQIPDPAPAAPPGTEDVQTVLNWASWIVAILCGLGVLIVAGTMAVQHRRYADAVAMATRGVALDSLAWGTRGLLGMNQLRVGAIAEGRAPCRCKQSCAPSRRLLFRVSLKRLTTIAKRRSRASNDPS